MKKIEQGSPGMDRTAKILEQAKARYEEEKRKANAKRRKAENLWAGNVSSTSGLYPSTKAFRAVGTAPFPAA